jgi:NitT/TauT family transport system permease protein
MIRTVFIPGVLPKLYDDIRVLTAISWTYIIVAELVNRSGGVGAMIYSAARQSRIDKVFALLLVIVLVGFLQDKLLSWLDKKLFPFKEAAK